MHKRSDYLSWDDYFMAVALLSAQRSKDPSTQVGACIVSPQNKIVGIGYNGFPIGCSDDELPWDREGEPLDTKYPYVCHAEMNAIVNSTQANLSGNRLYVSLFPCNECAKLIIQVGIKKVIYLSDKYAENHLFVAARKMFTMAGVVTEKLIPKRGSILLDFAPYL
ncbi:MAG: dCMP deaminase family protein [candidate division Zixibacteria bacterium]|jgi:dCMP deaminase|nr:dCMP deaminase family protein [candidate division Zixibacteria bacterium]